MVLLRKMLCVPVGPLGLRVVQRLFSFSLKLRQLSTSPYHAALRSASWWLLALPMVILTDSLYSLQPFRSWGKRSTASVLLSLERVEVRAFLYEWQGCPHPPKLEKVKDQDEAGRLAGKLKTLGNDLADSLAKEAPEGTALLTLTLTLTLTLKPGS